MPMQVMHIRRMRMRVPHWSVLMNVSMRLAGAVNNIQSSTRKTMARRRCQFARGKRYGFMQVLAIVVVECMLVLLINLKPSSDISTGFRLRDLVSAHVMPNAFIAAVIGSEKNTGSTRSTMSPETSRKFRLFSSGISALRAPLSIATCNGSARDRIGLMFP